MPTMVSKTCDYCKLPFQRTLRHENFSIKSKYKNSFCSNTCKAAFKETLKEIKCKQCNEQFTQTASIQKFCSQSCSGTYNNKHKKSGYRRSKLEVYLEEQIKSEFPSLVFETNNKSAIDSELDFYFPSLKLGIEINGIFHYEPIYGLEKLTSIQLNDARKMLIAAERNIELIVIPTREKYTSKKIQILYWENIKEILKRRLV